MRVYHRKWFEGTSPDRLVLRRIDERASCIVLRPPALEKTANVPLTYVEAVWDDPETGWTLAIAGSLFQRDHVSNVSMGFVPPGIR